VDDRYLNLVEKITRVPPYYFTLLFKKANAKNFNS
jgi:hypothetical protein